MREFCAPSVHCRQAADANNLGPGLLAWNSDTLVRQPSHFVVSPLSEGTFLSCTPRIPSVPGIISPTPPWNDWRVRRFLSQIATVSSRTLCADDATNESFVPLFDCEQLGNLPDLCPHLDAATFDGREQELSVTCPDSDYWPAGASGVEANYHVRSTRSFYRGHHHDQNEFAVWTQAQTYHQIRRHYVDAGFWQYSPDPYISPNYCSWNTSWKPVSHFDDQWVCHLRSGAPTHTVQQGPPPVTTPSPVDTSLLNSAEQLWSVYVSFALTVLDSSSPGLPRDELGFCRENGQHQHGGFCECGVRQTATDCRATAILWPSLRAAEYFTDQICRLFYYNADAPTDCPPGCVGHRGSGDVTSYNGDGTADTHCFLPQSEA